jgi:hypothetical protein
MPKRVETRREMLSAKITSINLASWGEIENGDYYYRFMVNGDQFNDAYLRLTPQQDNRYNVNLYWEPVTGSSWGGKDIGVYEVSDLSGEAMTGWTREFLSSLPMSQ